MHIDNIKLIKGFLLEDIFNFLYRFNFTLGVSLIKKKEEEVIFIKINEFCKFFKQDPSCEQIQYLKNVFLCPFHYLMSGFLYGCHECWPLAKNRNHARVLQCYPSSPIKSFNVLWCPSVFFHIIMFRFFFTSPSFFFNVWYSWKVI